MSDSFLSLLKSLISRPQNPAVNVLPQIAAANAQAQQVAQPSVAPAQPYYGSEGSIYTPQMILARNQAWVNPQAGNNYQTSLAPADEAKFRQWLSLNKIPFDPNQATPDYDMRGFWKGLQQGNPMAKGAIDPNDGQMHYPDYWKTPYDLTFSKQSKFANPQTAPDWNDNNELVSPSGQVVWNDSLSNMRQLIRTVPTLSDLQAKLNPPKSPAEIRAATLQTVSQP